MPQLASAEKNLRKSLKRRLWNKGKRSAAKTHAKRVMAAVAAGDVAKARAELVLATKKLDKAARTRAIHPNSAARHKSVLARAVAALAKQSVAPAKK